MSCFEYSKNKHKKGVLKTKESFMYEKLKIHYKKKTQICRTPLTQLKYFAAAAMHVEEQ